MPTAFITCWASVTDSRFTTRFACTSNQSEGFRASPSLRQGTGASSTVRWTWLSRVGNSAGLMRVQGLEVLKSSVMGTAFIQGRFCFRILGFESGLHAALGGAILFGTRIFTQRRRTLRTAGRKRQIGPDTSKAASASVRVCRTKPPQPTS